MWQAENDKESFILVPKIEISMFTIERGSKNVGVLLQRARKAKGISLRMLAKMATISVPTLIKLERGEGNIDLLEKYILALGLTPIFGFEMDEDAQRQMLHYQDLVENKNMPG